MSKATSGRVRIVTAMTSAIILSACSTDTAMRDEGTQRPVPHRTINYKLETVRTMGWESLSDSAGPLSAFDRRFSGGVLGAPVSAVMDDAGNTYVLDASFQKVSVFGPDGKFKANIAGGFGEGPGEYKRVSAMSLSGGHLHILDRGNNRVTILTTAGKVQREFSLSGGLPSQIAARGDSIFIVMERAGSAYPFVQVFNRLGERTDSLVRLTGQAADLASNGGLPIFGFRPSGDVLLALPTPTMWVEFSTREQRGTNFFPEAAGYLRKMAGMEVTDVPVRPKAIVGMAGGLTAVFYVEREGGQTQGKVKDNGFIDVYNANGVYSGSAEVDAYGFDTMKPTPTGNEILLTSGYNARYPMVMVSRLTKLSE